MTLGTLRSLVAFLLGLLIFFPYPALPIGTSTGLQFGHVIVLAAIALSLRSLLVKRDLLRAYLIMVLPIFVTIIPHIENPANLNAFSMHCVGLLAMLAVGVLDSRRFKYFMTAVCIAIIMHGIVGIWQQIAYLSESLPMTWIYANPSFSDLTTSENWEVYAKYTKRSFGIFPEPSAAFAALSPWLLLIGFSFLVGRDKGVGLSTRRLRTLMGVAFFLGMTLVYYSRSGGTPYLLLALLMPVLVYLRRASSSVSASRLIGALVLVAAGGLFGYLLIDSFVSRAAASLEVGASWDDRGASILFAINQIFGGSAKEFFFGYGIGEIPGLVKASTGTASVHSLIFSYVMAAGVFGLPALIYVIYACIRSIRASGWVLAGYAFLFLWLVCVTLVTGYNQLLAIWVALGVMLRWHVYYPDPAAVSGK